MTSKVDLRRYRTLQQIGCLACRKNGYYLAPDIHHLVDKGTRKHSGGNKATIPLCAWHHRGVPPTGQAMSSTHLYGPSLALSKRAFISRFGTERELLDEVDALIVKTDTL